MQEIRQPIPSGPGIVAGAWEWRNSANAPGDEAIRLRSVRLLNPEGRVTDQFFIGEAIAFELILDIAEPSQKYVYGFSVKDL